MIENIVFKQKTKVGNKIRVAKTDGLMLVEDGYIYLKFGFNKSIKDEVKSMEGQAWCGEVPNSTYRPPRPLPEALAPYGDKWWRVLDSHRNRFNLTHLFGGNPYEHYDKEITNLEYIRSLYSHQKEMADFAMARRRCIIAAEMGLGKTLCAIEVMERSRPQLIWYIAPRSVLRAIERELKIWNCSVMPTLLTYEGAVKMVENWQPGQVPPEVMIVDESARAKTPTAKRAQAIKNVADEMRSYWDDPYIILMSGAPAPKAPPDWFFQCEIACPGFIREGTIAKFKTRLGIFKEEESFSGGVYLKQITWLDDEKKCNKCGLYAEAHVPGLPGYHTFIPSKNEVHDLYRRMQGLTKVWFKKDCLDLPDKIYRIEELKPAPSVIRAAQLITKTAPTTIQALTLLRELSDGFQYVDKADGKQECSLCHAKSYIEKVQTDDGGWADAEVVCPNCNGSGEEDKIIRVADPMPSPKLDLFKDLLDEHHEEGRFVTYAGFTGSIDRLTETALAQKWSVIRVDGRGWKWYGDELQPEDFLECFQNQHDKYPRVLFLGHPGSAGEGLTLTASPSIFYYSNTFNASERIQSEDRIHRIGMDVNRGATIIDCFYLETDRLIHTNLKKKRDLQSLSMGVIQECLQTQEERIL